jgi:hypothetical protein
MLIAQLLGIYLNMRDAVETTTITSIIIVFGLKLKLLFTENLRKKLKILESKASRKVSYYHIHGILYLVYYISAFLSLASKSIKS